MKSPKPRIIVAGLGLITPLGNGAWATFRALLAGQTITDRARYLAPDVDPVTLVRSLGTVESAQRTATDPAVELAERAAREAGAEAGVGLEGLPAFIGTSKGAGYRMAEGGGWMADGLAHIAQEADRCFNHPRSPIPHPPFPSPHAYLDHHLVQRTGIAIRRHTVAACASSLVALDQARRFLQYPRRGDLSPPASALVLTSEAALVPMYIHSYRRLGVLAPLTRDRYRSLPLDEQRCGFILAEAGAAVVLRAVPPGDPVPPGSIELIDTATACDAYDLIRPNPEMDALKHLARRMSRHQHQENLPTVIHAHAPATADHDPAEWCAHQTVKKEARHEAGPKPSPRGEGPDQAVQPTPAPSGPSQRSGPASQPIPHPPSDIRHFTYASKGALGHTLGASGLVSLVIAACSARAAKLPPMPWLERPIDSSLQTTNYELPAATPHTVFAAGFAGHTAAAMIRRQPQT